MDPELLPILNAYLAARPDQPLAGLDPDYAAQLAHTLQFDWPHAESALPVVQDPTAATGGDPDVRLPLPGETTSAFDGLLPHLDLNRVYTARPGDNVSKILGTSRPGPIGAFALENGLDGPDIYSGDGYVLPDPNAPLPVGSEARGQHLLDIGNANGAGTRTASAAPLPLQGVWINGTHFPADNDVPAQPGSAASQSGSLPSLAGPPAAPHAFGTLRTLSNWDVLTRNIRNRYGEAENTIAAGPRLLDQRSVMNSPAENLALEFGAALDGVSGGLKRLAAPMSGGLDTATSLARGEGLWASPSVRADTDSTVTLGSLAASLFDPALGLEAAAPNPTGRFYTVAWETKLDPSVWGQSAKVHANRANAALDATLRSDPEFAAEMENHIPGIRAAVARSGRRTTPAGWTWHHDLEPGTMQLVPRGQHMPGSIFSDTLHPGGQGGYSLWAIPQGAPRR